MPSRSTMMVSGRTTISSLIVLSHYEAEPLLRARREGLTSCPASTDLGLTSTQAGLDEHGASFADGQRLAWPYLEEISQSELGCFVVEGDACRPVRMFSELTGRVYSLMPTGSAPTMLVSGLPMHRIKDTDPMADTLTKVRALAPLGGRVLDTATGLGYTAIQMAHKASQVVTIELDPAAQEICRLNPWSQRLFDSPKIRQLIGDSFEVLDGFEDGEFSAILHDPPTIQLAGELYSGEFYRKSYRVLKPRGRMFHYIGDPDSKSGASVTRGVIRRLKQAGFRRIVPAREAFGVVAYK